MTSYIKLTGQTLIIQSGGMVAYAVALEKRHF